MKHRIPTKAECDLICESNESFIKKEEIIEGTPVVQYNYLLAGFMDFMEPIKGNGDLKAFELRGLTFIQQEDGSWKHQLMLHKFFNMNQTIGYMHEDVKDKKIISVASKEDGSLIGFAPFESKARAKSKFSFQSDQAIAAQNIYENEPEIKRLVDHCLANDLSPLFEYVAPDNRIVVLYPRPELRFLQVRVNKTGEYLDIHSPEFEGYDVLKAKRFNKTLDELIKDADEVEGVEGWVVTYPDQMMKIKTQWYFALHRLVSPDSLGSKPHLLVECSLSEGIDDLLGALEEEGGFDELHAWISNIDDVTRKFTNHCTRTVKEMLEAGKEMTRKDFAIQNNGHPMFGIMMKFFDREIDMVAIDKQVRDYIRKNVRTEKKGNEYFEMMEKKVEEAFEAEVERPIKMKDPDIKNNV